MHEELSAFLTALARCADTDYGFLLLDPEGRYRLVSKNIADSHDLAIEDHVGLEAAVLAPDLWAQTQPYLADVFGGREATFEVEDIAPRLGHVHRLLRVHAFPVYGNEHVLLGAGMVVEDITAARAGELALQNARRRAAVANLAELALGGDDSSIQELCDAACAEVAETLGVPIARVIEATRGSARMEMRGGVGLAWDAGAAGTRPGSYVEYVMRSRTPVIIDNLSDEHRFRPPATLVAHGVRSSLAVAVRDSRGPWGMLSAHSLEPRRFTDDEARFVAEIANVLALAVRAREAMAFQKELISITSHEMRTPLTTIIGMGQRLERSLRRKLPDDESSELAQLVVEEGLRLNSMIDRWLGVAEVQTGRDGAQERTALDLVAHVARQVELARRRHPTLQFTETYSPQVTEVVTDPGRIAEILDNLLENAFRYAGPTARVTVEVSRHESQVVIAVADDGPGISAEALGHIFERFYRGETGSRGLGVGLYVSRALAEELGGTMDVESSPGAGARFSLTLPC